MAPGFRIIALKVGNGSIELGPESRLGLSPFPASQEGEGMVEHHTSAHAFYCTWTLPASKTCSDQISISSPLGRRRYSIGKRLERWPCPDRFAAITVITKIVLGGKGGKNPLRSTTGPAQEAC